MLAQSQSVGNIQLLITDPLPQTDEPDNNGLILSKTFSCLDDLLGSRAPIDGQMTTCRFEITTGGLA